MQVFENIEQDINNRLMYYNLISIMWTRLFWSKIFEIEL